MVQVQQCPMVGKLMRAILNSVQQRCGGRWVGLSVIHLGDRDVPNALVFIDKYTQGTHFVVVSVCYRECIITDSRPSSASSA